MHKVTGIGGIIFKAKDPQTLRAWYQEHLGIELTHGFFEFKWTDEPTTKAPGSTVFGIFEEDSSEFAPSEKPFLINFRVNDLKALLKELGDRGITISDKIDEVDFGTFGWFIDPEGNKIQLWEPAARTA